MKEVTIIDMMNLVNKMVLSLNILTRVVEDLKKQVDQLKVDQLTKKM